MFQCHRQVKCHVGGVAELLTPPYPLFFRRTQPRQFQKLDFPPLTSAPKQCLPSNGFTMRHMVVPLVTPPGTASRPIFSRRAVLEGKPDPSEPCKSPVDQFRVSYLWTTALRFGQAVVDKVVETHPDTRSKNACEDRAPSLKLDRGTIPFAAPAVLSDRGDSREPKVGETPMDSDDTFPLFVFAIDPYVPTTRFSTCEV